MRETQRARHVIVGAKPDGWLFAVPYAAGLRESPRESVPIDGRVDRMLGDTERLSYLRTWQPEHLVQIAQSGGVNASASTCRRDKHACRTTVRPAWAHGHLTVRTALDVADRHSSRSSGGNCGRFWSYTQREVSPEALAHASVIQPQLRAAETGRAVVGPPIAPPRPRFPTEGDVVGSRIRYPEFQQRHEESPPGHLHRGDFRPNRRRIDGVDVRELASHLHRRHPPLCSTGIASPGAKKAKRVHAANPRARMRAFQDSACF